jgi:hypothetical protein
LARGFLDAGAANWQASLWRVNNVTDSGFAGRFLQPTVRGPVQAGLSDAVYFDREVKRVKSGLRSTFF